NCARSHFNLALTLLAAGDYRDGWREYEWRWEGGNLDRQDFSKPQWRGEDIAGKTLLLHTEQGFGDVLQFCRYAPLAAIQARVILAAPRPLARLLGSLQDVECIASNGDPLPPFDV